MKADTARSPEATILVGLIVAAGAVGVVGWLAAGPRMFVQLIELGLAWCF